MSDYKRPMTLRECMEAEKPSSENMATDQRAACGVDSSADSAKAKGPQVASPAVAHQTPRTDAVIELCAQGLPPDCSQKDFDDADNKLEGFDPDEGGALIAIARQLERELTAEQNLRRQAQHERDAMLERLAAAALAEREACAEDCSHKAFLTHTHDEFGKGRERGLLDACELIRARAAAGKEGS